MELSSSEIPLYSWLLNCISAFKTSGSSFIFRLNWTCMISESHAILCMKLINKHTVRFLRYLCGNTVVHCNEFQCKLIIVQCYVSCPMIYVHCVSVRAWEMHSFICKECVLYMSAAIARPLRFHGVVGVYKVSNLSPWQRAHDHERCRRQSGCVVVEWNAWRLLNTHEN